VATKSKLRTEKLGNAESLIVIHSCAAVKSKSTTMRLGYCIVGKTEIMRGLSAYRLIGPTKILSEHFREGDRG
jgi:hypothetical protein